MSIMVTTIVTKASVAKRIFDEVTSDNFKLPEGYRTPRGVFIQRAQKEALLTPAGAATYFQNFKKEAKEGRLMHKRTARKSSAN